MSKVEVKPEKLRAFAGMLGEAGADAKDTGGKMDSYFFQTRGDIVLGGASSGAEAISNNTSTEDTIDGAYGAFCLSYCSIGSEVFSFYSQAEGALDQAKAAHGDMATEYEKVDADNADEVGSVYRDDETVAKKADPEEEWGSSAGRTNHSDKDFEYVPCGTELEDPDEAAAGKDSLSDPRKRFDIPELKEYSDAAQWASSWGMDVVLLIMQFTGDWAKAHADVVALRTMAKRNNDIAGNIVSGNRQIAETWTGESAQASQKYMGWLADNIAGCENTLESFSQALYGYIEDIDQLASEIAYCIGWFLWEADWALSLQTPNGPFTPFDVSILDGVGGIDKAEKAEYTSKHGLMKADNFKGSWRFLMNKYVATAYATILGGLFHQYESMLTMTSLIWGVATGLESPANSAKADLVEASDRLAALGNWGK